MQSSFRNILSRLNPFSPTFLKITNTSQEEKLYRQQLANSQGRAESDNMAEIRNEMRKMFNGDSTGYAYADNEQGLLAFENSVTGFNKSALIGKYREMENYPEISDALDYICDEAIFVDKEKRVCTLSFKRELPPDIKRIMQAEFNYITFDALELHKNAWNWFRRWVVDGEFYGEKILNDQRDRIIGLKQLNPMITYPIYAGEEILYFLQKETTRTNQTSYVYQSVGDTEFIRLNNTQVVYSNFGQFGSNYIDIQGFLHSAIQPYEWLKTLEISLLIYRIVRAPERFLFNVEVGKMPTGKAREEINKLKDNYRKREFFNPSNGAIDLNKAFMSMVDDIWLMKREGQGTTIEPIGGNMNLGEINDVDHFIKKLYKALKLPRNRWGISDTQENYPFGKPGELTYEEHKFHLMADRMRGSFGDIVVDAFFTQLRLDGVPEQYISHDYISITFTDSNLFQKEKEKMIFASCIEQLTSASQFIMTKENQEGLLPRKFVMEEVFGGDKFEQIETMREEQIALWASETANAQTQPTDDGMGDMGGMDTGSTEEDTGSTDTEQSTETDQNLAPELQA